MENRRLISEMTGEIVMNLLDDALGKVEHGTRREDILEDILRIPVPDPIKFV